MDGIDQIKFIVVPSIQVTDVAGEKIVLSERVLRRRVAIAY